MNVLYTSPIFKQANGSPRQSWIPLRALDTYERRDSAILQLKALGDINAPDTEETRKLLKVIRAAKRKIDREMWFSRSVE